MLCDDGTLLLLFRGGGPRAAPWIRTYGTQEVQASVFPGWGREAVIGLAKTACLPLRQGELCKFLCNFRRGKGANPWNEVRTLGVETPAVTSGW